MKLWYLSSEGRAGTGFSGTPEIFFQQKLSNNQSTEKNNILIYDNRRNNLDQYLHDLYAL